MVVDKPGSHLIQQPAHAVQLTDYRRQPVASGEISREKAENLPQTLHGARPAGQPPERRFILQCAPAAKQHRRRIAGPRIPERKVQTNINFKRQPQRRRRAGQPGLMPQAEVTLRNHLEMRSAIDATRYVHHQQTPAALRIDGKRQLLAAQGVEHDIAAAQLDLGRALGDMGCLGDLQVAITREGQEAAVSDRQRAYLGIAQERAGFRPATPCTATSPSGSSCVVALRMRTACKGRRQAPSRTHQTRSAGSATSRNGRLAVWPVLTETGNGSA